MDQDQKLVVELRNQAGNLAAATQMLCERLEGRVDDKEREYLCIINQGAYRLVRTAHDMGLVNQPDLYFDPRPLDLAGLCRDICRQVEYLAETIGVTFLWELEEGSLITRGDEEMLTQAVTGLIANAMEFAGKGTVRLRFDRDKTGRQARVQVVDDGAKLEEEDERDPLRKVRSPAGMTLRGARRAAELHGGRLVLENRREGGVRAVISLPIRKAERPLVKEPPPMRVERRGGFSPVMVALSGVLPPHLYQPEELE